MICIIRIQTKAAFETNGISMPDETREVVFPKGVPVHMQDIDPKAEQTNTLAASDSKDNVVPDSSSAEGAKVPKETRPIGRTHGSGGSPACSVTGSPSPYCR